MGNPKKTGHSRARGLDPERIDQILRGTVPSNSPSPYNMRFGRTVIQRTPQASLPPQPGSIYSMPGQLNGQGGGRQASQLQHQRRRPPSVIVIDDSDSEDGGGVNRQAPIAQQARYNGVDQDLHQEAPIAQQAQHDHEGQNIPQNQQDQFAEQDGQDGDVDDAQQSQSPGPAFLMLDNNNNNNNNNLLEAQQSQQLQEAQEQTLALLELPEVNIPENERLQTPQELMCDLLPHQRVGLTWLIRQEQDPSKNGSILADGMGLGKTVEALALIISRRFDPEHPLTCKTTLIVAPLGLLQQWRDEIHTKVTLRHGRKLTAIIFHGSSMNNMTAQHLLEYDIVLCTYGKLVSEYNCFTKGRQNKCKILARGAKFFRVILDEAHYIKNKNTQTSKAVCQVQAVHRLCMTGTPLMNNVTELFPLIRFLGIKPYDAWEKFSEHIDRPIRRWTSGMESDAMLRLQTLVKTLMLRRHKESRLDNERIITLRKRVDIQVYIEFGPEQKAFYEALQQRQKLKFNMYLKEGIVMKNYMEVLTWVLRLRQACDHPYLVQNHCIPDVCSLDAEGMLRLALQLPAHAQESINAIRQFRCPKCADSSNNITKNPVIISPCGHYICADCYSWLMEEGYAPPGDDTNEPNKFNCPNEGCDSIITPGNVLMHNFFVDAHKQAENNMDVLDDNDELSDDESDLVELDSGDDGEIEDFRSDSQRSLRSPSINGQREGSEGLFVDPYPNEPDSFSQADSSGGELSMSGDEEQFSSIRDPMTPAVAGSAPHQNSRSSANALSGNFIAFDQPAASPSPAQTMARPFHSPSAKGTYGNPVDLDDEEDVAAFNAVSRQMAAGRNQEYTRGIKNEIKDEDAEGFDIPNYDGPGSPAPRFKRKATESERSGSASKRARSSRSRIDFDEFNSGMPNDQLYMESEDEENAFASPSAYRVNTVDDDGGQQHRSGDEVEQQEQVEDEEDVKPDIHGLGQRAREVLQRPFVSLSSKRQVADKNQRAMVAYQKRLSNEWVASAKTDKIMELLQDIRRDHRGEKTLIFSLWTTFLDMLEPPLRAARFKYTFYNGGMKTDNRTAAVQTFMTNPELEVMLISLCAGNCGLNLTAANHVILAEPFWNPFTEEQAIDRAHRIGQRKKVTVYRILAKDTIEDHIVCMQQKKKVLVSAALCDAKADSPANKLTIDELRALFGV